LGRYRHLHDVDTSIDTSIDDRRRFSSTDLACGIPDIRRSCIALPVPRQQDTGHDDPDDQHSQQKWMATYKASRPSNVGIVSPLSPAEKNQVPSRNGQRDKDGQADKQWEPNLRRDRPWLFK
jgi:hypothetical protein